ncbi:MAG: EthD family reductase [Candidatus Dormibacteria bacterium]
MVKWTALYKQPEDTAAFEKWFLEQHLPICREWPDVDAIHASRITGSPRGESEFYWMFEATYPDRDTMMKSLMSEKGMEAAMDARGSAFGKLMSSFFSESV